MSEPTLTISAAARLCRRDRRTIQRAIRTGHLHLDAQHRLSRDELILIGYLEEEAPQLLPQPLPQGIPQQTPQSPPHEPPQPSPQPAPQAIPAYYGRPSLSPATLQAITDERAWYPDLTMRAFAQHLFDAGSYRGRASDGREVPADHSRLRRWLQQAQRQG